MRRLKRWLAGAWAFAKVAGSWLAAGFIAFLAMSNIYTMPILAGMVVVPVANNVRDMYAKALIKMIAFMGIVFLMLNYAELALILAAWQVREAGKSWIQWIRMARWERLHGVEYVLAD